MTEIRPEWLLQLAPQYFDLKTFQDGETKRALVRVQQKLSGKRVAEDVGGDRGYGKEGKKKKHKAK